MFYINPQNAAFCATRHFNLSSNKNENWGDFGNTPRVWNALKIFTQTVDALAIRFL